MVAAGSVVEDAAEEEAAVQHTGCVRSLQQAAHQDVCLPAAAAEDWAVEGWEAAAMAEEGSAAVEAAERRADTKRQILCTR
jgi:hypothetical protein